VQYQHLEKKKKNTTGDRAYPEAITNEGAQERRGVASNNENLPTCPGATSGRVDVTGLASASDNCVHGNVLG
jgi:hypothetical protein